MMKKVLLLLGGANHPSEACGRILADFLTTTAGCEVVATADAKTLTGLGGFDAVVLYCNAGLFTPAQERGLVSFVEGGGGLVGLHHCTSVMGKKNNDAYLDMLGTRLIGHGHFADFTVEHTDAADAIVPRVAKSFVIADELYKLQKVTKKQLRPFQYGLWEFERVMLGYTRSFGKGRVLYSALGHDERAFSHPEFQDLVFKAVRYVTGDKETPVRWGLVGYGPLYGMGGHHAGIIRRTVGLKLAAVCDKDPARLDTAREEQGDDVEYFLDLKELIGSKVCDGVTAIVPHNVHAAVALPCLEAGLHLVSEKPFAITPAECDQMIAAARASGVMLSVYHNRHWDADMWTIRTVVESGAIGDVFAIEHHMCGYGPSRQEWRSHKPVSGGLLYDMGAHGFEKVFQVVPKTDARGNPINRRARLFGNFLKKVWWDTTVEDYCRAYVKFDTGLEATVIQSRISSAPRPQWVVSGTKGSCVDTGNGIELRQWVGGAIRTTMVPYVEGLDRQSYYRNIADHLHAGVPLIITPQLGKAAIQCIHGCEVAARENRLVEVEFEF